MDYFFDGTKEALEKLIAQAVQAALSKREIVTTDKADAAALSARAPYPSSAPIIVAVCCSDCLTQPIQDELKIIEEKQIKIQIEEADEWDDSVELQHLVSTSQVILFPALSENVIAKMANGIFEEPLSRLLLEAIKQSKPFYTIAPEADIALRKNSPALFRLQQTNRQKLDQFGVRWIERKDIAKVLLSALPKSTFKDIPSKVSRGEKQLITAQDIEKAAKEGQRKLQLPYRSIITPLAKDRAKELNIILELKG